MTPASHSLSDHDAQEIVRLFRSTLSPAEKLDQLLPRLHLPGRPAQNLSNLRNVFEDAHQDHIDLLNPPKDFHQWLQKPLRRKGEELGAAKPNTVNARASTLANLYAALEGMQLIRGQPLWRLPRPTREQASDPLPSRELIHTLHQAARKNDPELFAALLLIDHLAFTWTALEGLHWDELDLLQKRLLRRTESQLTGETLHALQALVTQQALFDETPVPGKVFTNLAGLRTRLWKLCGTLDEPFISPAKLRLAGLRDHGASSDPQQAGYLDPRAHREAIALARALAERPPQKKKD